MVKTRVGIESTRSINLTLKDNLVTCSENVGYEVQPLDCNETKDIYENNKAYSNLQGAVISSRYSRQSHCYKISGFVIWKSTAFGLLYNGDHNVVFEQNILIENQIGVTATIFRHWHLNQIFSNSSVIVKNTTFIGQTSSFECGDMVWVRSKRFTRSSILGSDWYNPNGMAGIVFPKFNSIDGLTKVGNVTFARYGDSVCQKNYAITTNLGGNEFQRPIHTEKIILNDVDYGNKIFFQRQRR